MYATGCVAGFVGVRTPDALCGQDDEGVTTTHITFGLQSNDLRYSQGVLVLPVKLQIQDAYVGYVWMLENETTSPRVATIGDGATTSLLQLRRAPAKGVTAARPRKQGMTNRARLDELQEYADVGTPLDMVRQQHVLLADKRVGAAVCAMPNVHGAKLCSLCVYWRAGGWVSHCTCASVCRGAAAAGDRRLCGETIRANQRRRHVQRHQGTSSHAGKETRAQWLHRHI